MKSCLVVDDTDLDRRMSAICATKSGFAVSEAKSGEEALEICRNKLPDCVLLDWEMTGMDGITLVKELRELKDSKSTTILICTSHEHPSFIGHAYVSGANGYITKPITPQKLREKFTELGIAA